MKFKMFFSRRQFNMRMRLAKSKMQDVTQWEMEDNILNIHIYTYILQLSGTQVPGSHSHAYRKTQIRAGIYLEILYCFPPLCYLIGKNIRNYRFCDRFLGKHMRKQHFISLILLYLRRYIESFIFVLSAKYFCQRGKERQEVQINSESSLNLT